MFDDLVHRFRRLRERSMSPDTHLRRQIEKEEKEARKVEKEYKKLLKKATKKGEKVTKSLNRQTPEIYCLYANHISILTAKVDSLSQKKISSQLIYYQPRTKYLINQLDKVVIALEKCEEDISKRPQLSRWQSFCDRFRRFRE